MGSSVQLQQHAEFLDSTRTRFLAPGLDIATVRDICERLHRAGTEPEGVTYAEVEAGGVPALWCIPEGADTEHALLDFHFGGSVVASMHSDRKAAGHIAKAAGIRSLVVDFRLAPEHKYPAQVDDAETAFRWLLEQGYRAENIGSTGHSIGGYLAVKLALRRHDQGEALPGAVLSISPWCDMRLTNTTVESNADSDKLLTKPLLEFFRESWLGGTSIEWNDPNVSLVDADLTGLPPTNLFYGEYELFAGEDAEFGQRLSKFGVDAEVHVLPQGQHSFNIAAGRVPEVDQAINEMGRWLRKTLGLPAAS
jgi:epsilon-lactone hydrolase